MKTVLFAIFTTLLSKRWALWSVCVYIYVVFEDTNLYNDMGMT